MKDNDFTIYEKPLNPTFYDDILKKEDNTINEIIKDEEMRDLLNDVRNDMNTFRKDIHYKVSFISDHLSDFPPHLLTKNNDKNQVKKSDINDNINKIYNKKKYK